MLDPKQAFEPRIKSRVMPDGTIVSPALEDMFPFLDPEELARNMPSFERVRGCWREHAEWAVKWDCAGPPCSSISTGR